MEALWKAAILGVVEGATEFLPVSSTGHLIVVGDWLNFTGDVAKTFSVFIQLGAILAIVWLYRSTFSELLRGLGRSRQSWGFALNLGLAFLPAAVAGLLLHDWIKAHLFSPLTVGVALALGGVLILLIERMEPRIHTSEARDVTPRHAFQVGLAQVLALIPGVSRSGATILGGYALGLSRKAATEFSFFLAVPVMLAATGFDLYESRHVLDMTDAPMFAVGFLVAFFSALVVVRALVAYVSKQTFRHFAWYRIAFGLALLLLYAT